MDSLSMARSHLHDLRFHPFSRWNHCRSWIKIFIYLFLFWSHSLSYSKAHPSFSIRLFELGRQGLIKWVLDITLMDQIIQLMEIMLMPLDLVGRAHITITGSILVTRARAKWVKRTPLPSPTHMLRLVHSSSVLPSLNSGSSFIGESLGLASSASLHCFGHRESDVWTLQQWILARWLDSPLQSIHSLLPSLSSSSFTVSSTSVLVPYHFWSLIWVTGLPMRADWCDPPPPPIK